MADRATPPPRHLPPLLRRALGTRPGLRVVFEAMRRRYVPAAAGGFTGVIAFALADVHGRVGVHRLYVDGEGARVVGGEGAGKPALTLSLSVDDFFGVATGELDPMYLVLRGRLKLQGDFALALRLGPMFRG